MERLLKYFKPENYKLKLFIDKHAGTARGSVKITGTPLKDKIKLHAKGLTIDRITLDGAEVKWKLNNDELVIAGERVTRAGGTPNFAATVSAKLGESAGQDPLAERTVIIDYHFNLNTNMMGCYLSSYDHAGTEHRLVSTQFESHYARECFPCIDEPAAKATFDLEITVPDLEDTIIANTPIKNIKKTAEEKTVTFETTPKMSTYLLAFCIGEFQSRKTKSKHGVEVTTYCALNQDLNSIDFANQIAADALDYYDDAFGIPYPLPKLDQIAIPDFEAGAMENWGLVTYRESCLLSGETATIDDRQYVATVIAHELSHQWFGNLVTMEWWNNLWLNESFATMMEYLCIDAIRPEYKILEDFFIGECRAALNRDALPGVQAVQQDVDDPAEIATLFDGAIVYAKGARLMFMLYRLMGERSFFAGLKEYFKAYKYGNTTGDDLWVTLQKHADFDVKQFMDAWISQPGYPVITDDHQQRFLLSGVTDNTTWPLPKITDDMSGHYLINLSAEEFEEKLAKFGDLNFEQKVRLLLDRSLLSKTPIVSTALHLELLPYFRVETDDSLWGPISGLIGDLKPFFPVSNPDFDRFKQYVLYIVKPQLDRLGYKKRENESENDTKLRSSVLGLALFSENEEVLRHLAVLPTSDPETRYAVLYARLRQNEAEEFPKLLKKYQKTSDPDLKNDLLSVLTSAREHNSELIDLLKQPKIVRPQDHLYLFAYLIRNYKTQKDAFAWIYKNWDYVCEITGEKSIEDYPRIMANVIRTNEKAEEFNNFFAKFSENPILKRTLEVAKNEINARLTLIATDNKDVHNTLKRLEF